MVWCGRYPRCAMGRQGMITLIVIAKLLLIAVVLAMQK